MAGPGLARPLSAAPDPGGRVYVAHAEDDHHAGSGPKASVHKPNDAMDDAADVRVLHNHVPQRFGTLLGGFKRGWDSDTGLCDGLGAT